MMDHQTSTSPISITVAEYPVTAITLAALFILGSGFVLRAATDPLITIVVDQECRQKAVVCYAEQELLKGCEDLVSPSNSVRLSTSARKKGRIELVVDPTALNGVKGASVKEGFRLITRSNGSVTLTGADDKGLLWGVRDFVHYYAEDWVKSLKSGKYMTTDVTMIPSIQRRGLWTWWYGCYDPYAYVDRASEWKLNTIIFWNRGVPLDAERLNSYAHERGVGLWWGFSWGWTAGDFADASPALAKRLYAIYERQKKAIGPTLGNLCPHDAETPQALMDYVLDVFERQYAWIPKLDGIYFQTATEALCPCPTCKTAPRGEGFIRTILPIIKELHRRYPDLLISCGVHNTGNKETFKALTAIPDYCNICWEAGVTWAPSREVAKDQMTYRGSGEDFAGIYRVTMNCGLVLRGESIKNESPRVWIPRIETLWDYLEEGKLPAGIERKNPITVDGKPVGYACSSDWRPAPGKRQLDNANLTTLLAWSRDLAQGQAAKKGVFILVEAGMMDLKMRRVPALAAEVIWNPSLDEKELERRCEMIWRKKVGNWNEPVIPFWKTATAADPFGVKPLEDLGNAYRLINTEEKKTK